MNADNLLSIILFANEVMAMTAFKDGCAENLREFVRRAPFMMIEGGKRRERYDSMLRACACHLRQQCR